VSD
jgi:hypothetical protein